MVSPNTTAGTTPLDGVLTPEFSLGLSISILDRFDILNSSKRPRNINLCTRLSTTILQLVKACVGFLYHDVQVDYMKQLIPGLGEKTTRQKIRELEKKAATLPVIFALLFTESLKGFINFISIPYITVPSPVKFFIAAMIVALLYIYEANAGMYAKEVKETVEDVANPDD